MLSILQGAVLAAAGAPAPVFPLPFAPAAPEPALASTRWTAVPAAIRELARHERITLAAVPIDASRFVDLDLERIDHGRMRFQFRVDDAERGDLLDGLDLSLWRGTVRGAAESEVMLSFSQHGSRGWIRTGSTLLHVLPRPSADGSWSQGDVLLATEDALLALGMRNELACAATPAPGATPSAAGTGSSGAARLESQSGVQALTCAARVCPVSITSDFQLFQRFNSLPAQTAYVTTLLGFVSDRYELQASTLLTFPYVQFYTTAADPWLTPDTAPATTDCGDVLNELQQAWVGAIPNGGRIGHLLSGANLGCGVAWLDVLCDNTFNFSVSGNLNGTISFPIVQQPNNWDFIVVAHEIGHNFDALHTHDYCPPLDECPPTQYFGACQTQQVCSNQGTIMSYCHLCAGGTANITTFFHPRSAQDMTAAAANCLDCLLEVDGDAPSALVPGSATTLTARVTGSAPTAVDLLWSLGNGPFDALAMTNTGGNTWSATLPALACGSSVRFAYRVNDASFGLVHDPAGGTGAPYAADALVIATVLDDDFQADLGWTTSVQGATSGQWQRGVPVDDPAWAYDPATDADGSGACWLTQNANGNTDVDNGSVTLVSPNLDLSGGGAAIEYFYYLRLTNTDGADRLLVEGSANGLAGPWVVLATHTGDTGGGWTHVLLDTGALAAAGLPASATTRVRFTANDGGTQSIVEAGVDAFLAARRSCPTFSAFCAGDGSTVPCPCGNAGGAGRGCANSSFAGGAVLSASGTASVTGDTVGLSAASLTGSTCVFFQGSASSVPAVVDDGLGCVGGTIVRLGTKPIAGNSSSFPQGGDPLVSVRGAIPPAGGTYFYQAFYRNAAAAFCPPATSNRTNGAAVVWAP